MNPPDPASVAVQAKFLKLLFFVMVFAVGMYAVALQVINPSSEQLPDVVKIALEGCALATGLIVLFVRFVKIAGVLVPDTPIPAAERLAKLRMYFITCYCLSEVVAVYGFVLRFMGTSLMDAAPFFAGSLLLFALCFPRLPSDLDRSQ
jgi:hypothetical protein